MVKPDSSEDPNVDALESPILWQNHAHTVTLLDIPHSIAAAQGVDFRQRRLLSSSPLQSPFPSNEPKSAAAKEKVETNIVDASLQAKYLTVLEQALRDVRESFHEDFCLPRPFIVDSARAVKKRKLEVAESHRSPKSHAALHVLPSDFFSSLAGYGTTQSAQYSMALVKDSGVPLEAHSQNVNNSDHHFFSRRSEKTTTLQIQQLSSTKTFNFFLPPQSSFYLGNCSDSQSFRSAIRSQAQEFDTRKHFDFILLDPPWPNHSVRRTHKTANSSYDTAASLWDIRSLILNMDLDMLMSEDCLVAIWITNKPAVRNLVLGADGIFECWGVEFFEEWLWLKTTVHGEPVTPLEGVWRKPYEVLLLGRKRIRYSQIMQARRDSDTPRRVIISVPDLHSRKPCLKTLIDPFMPGSHDYRALEVFARHLVAGWWSWADECIKFNWEGYWRENTSDVSTTTNYSEQAEAILDND